VSSPQPSRLPAVPEPKLPDTVAVSVNARARSAGLFSSEVDVDVVNDGPSPLICDIRGRTPTREIQLQPGYVWIDPNTTGTLHVRVGLRWPRIHTVIVRLRDSSREYLAETPVHTPIALLVLPAVALLALLLIAGLIASGALLPRVQALTAPAHVTAGDRVEVDYATAGLGSVGYVVRNSSGVVASGTLPHGASAFGFRTDRNTDRYAIDLTISGIAGGASAERIVQAKAPPPAPRVASIRSLDIQPSVAVGGTPIDVRYAASAQSGTLRLVDANGTPWDAAPYSSKGSVLLHAPHVDAPEHFTIRLDVRNGTSVAAASTGVVVVPSPSPAPSSSPGAGATPPPAALTNVNTTPAYVVSGTYFAVTLHGAASHVSGRATLQNAAGTPLQAQDVAPGQDAKFIAPSVKRPTTFYVMVSATHDKTGQLIVVPVVIHPG
jgi:hypothetical protein